MAAETLAEKTRRASAILKILRKTYPDARCTLDHTSALELLVATILAAQCTDARVNIVTKELFRKYATPQDYIDVDPRELEKDIRSTGFYRNKTKSLRAAAARIVETYGGQVPQTMDDLLTLPGVARKTANVVLGTFFGKNEGIVVDTHVIRVSGRLGFTQHDSNQGDRIEKDLTAIVPRKDRTIFGHTLVFHGRQCCTARSPNCPGCPVNKLCPSAFSFGKGSQ